MADIAHLCKFYEVIKDPSRYGCLPDHKPWCHSWFQQCFYPRCKDKSHIKIAEGFMLRDLQLSLFD